MHPPHLLLCLCLARLILAWPASLPAQPPSAKALRPEELDAAESFQKGDRKTAIAFYQAQLASALPPAQSEWQVKLAIATYQDQEVEKAFLIYLSALDNAPLAPPPPFSEAEQALYARALKEYLDHPGSAASQTARRMLEEYAPHMAKHPEYYHLNLLLAAAYANIGEFADFFRTFYHSYPHLSTSYMAYKTKAILHLKLFERARSAQEKEKQRKALIENVESASALNHADTALYRLIIAFATPAEKPGQTKAVLNKIVNENIIVPRADIFFYAQQAIENQQFELAQRFVNAARQWYAHSKQVDAAQNFINAHKPH